MAKISIVMPVYNTKDFVGKAIQSILDQTFKDYEFFIIDNGSTDGSGEIIDLYAAKDKRIKVIRNKKNVFIAEARNAAIEKLSGEYLYLIDSDDWVLPDMLEIMYAGAMKNKAQYVVTGYYMDYYEGGKELSYAVCPDDVLYTQEEFRKNAIKYLTRTILTVPWNKLYSLDYLREKGIRFRNTKLEDHHFNMDIIMDVERVCMISKPFYHYYRSRQGTDSQLVYRKYLNQKKREHFLHTLEVYKHWGINDDKTMSMLADYHLGRLIQCLAETVGNNTINKKEKKQEIYTIFEDKNTKFALKYCNKRSIKNYIFMIPFISNSMFLTFIMAKSINLFKRNCPALFSLMRANLAQKAERKR